MASLDGFSSEQLQQGIPIGAPRTHLAAHKINPAVLAAKEKMRAEITEFRRQARTVMSAGDIVDEWGRVMRSVIKAAQPGAYHKDCLGLVLDSIGVCVLPIPEDASQMALINERGDHLIAFNIQSEGGQ